MSDLLITDEALEAAARAFAAARIEGWERYSELTHNALASPFRPALRAALEAALPHLQRQHLDLAGTLGYGLGRRDAAEDIAQAIEAAMHTSCREVPRLSCLTCDGVAYSAKTAREFATRPSEPSGDLTHPEVPEPQETRSEVRLLANGDHHSQEGT